MTAIYRSDRPSLFGRFRSDETGLRCEIEESGERARHITAASLNKDRIDRSG
jgi:hypothetical protein